MPWKKSIKKTCLSINRFFSLLTLKTCVIIDVFNGCDTETLLWLSLDYIVRKSIDDTELMWKITTYLSDSNNPLYIMKLVLHAVTHVAGM